LIAQGEFILKRMGETESMTAAQAGKKWRYLNSFVVKEVPANGKNMQHTAKHASEFD
jgi:hypothetical protein